VADPRDEFTLLCEFCGYAVEELGAEGHCPECGRPIAASLPARRDGTPWQRRPSAVSWWRTVCLVLRRPIGVWAIMRIEPARAGLGRVNTWLAAGFIATVAIARLVREARLSRAGASPPDASWWSQAVSALTLAAWGALGFVALYGGALVGLSALTQVEAWGVRFFGKRRGWRVTPTVADAVCGHASVGWLIAATLWAACALAVDTGWARWAVAELNLPRPRPSIWLRVLAPVSGFMIGLLIFEFLVYFGIRRNRFANRARPASVERARP
jgi:hypothetical protein